MGSALVSSFWRHQDLTAQAPRPDWRSGRRLHCACVLLHCSALHVAVEKAAPYLLQLSVSPVCACCRVVLARGPVATHRSNAVHIHLHHPGLVRRMPAAQSLHSDQHHNISTLAKPAWGQSCHIAELPSELSNRLRPLICHGCFARNNENLGRLSCKIMSPLVFAHVRAAYPGMPVSEQNCHPFQVSVLAPAVRSH